MKINASNFNKQCVESLLVREPIRASGVVAHHSHFNQPVRAGEGVRSRSWGDAPLVLQEQVIEKVISESGRAGFLAEEQLFLLGLIYIESGFNPGAAASSSSATGLGQFIDRTGEAYGIGKDNRFDLKQNIKAVIRHTKENLVKAEKYISQKGSVSRFEYAYGFHHDGPSLKYGGLEIARRRLTPMLNSLWNLCLPGMKHK